MASTQISRRGFLAATAAAGSVLVVGFRADRALASGPLVPNPFVRIDADGTVTVIAKHFEMGQGTTTGLSTLIAEELDADWASVRVEWAPADASRYANLSWGPFQGTGGSSAIANSWIQYRQAGAAARDLLLRAASARWGLSPETLETEAGRVLDRDSGQSLGYGELVAEASALEPLAEPPLKSPDQFRLIGTVLPRKDSAAKTDGSAVFTIDLHLPDMLTAVVARPPRFGGRVAALDDAAARAVPGVVDVRQIPQGVVVYAANTYAALRGREALTIEWDLTGTEGRSSVELEAEYRALLNQPGLPARSDGDAAAALAQAEVVSAEFVMPFLAHAPMEPLDCVVQVGADGADIWAGSQYPTVEQAVAAQILGLDPAQVRIHTQYAGGSFGRRATPNADYVAEAVQAAQALGDGRPVKVVWTREDDVRGGFYRPMYAHRIEAALGPDGLPGAWRHRIVGQSILKGTAFEPFLVRDGIDGTSVEGAANLSYAIPNLQVELHTTDVGVPVLWWRAVGHTHTAHATEVMINLLAARAGQDPVAYRLAMMQDHPRHAGVLRLAAEKAGWDQPLPAGRFRGIAVHESFLSYVAQVVEISLDAAGAVRVERIVCAVDCGLAVNPDIVRAQMEGGSIFALSAAMFDAITLAGGVPEQSNFHDYRPIRMSEAPQVEVHIVPSAEAPTGVGEPGVPSVAPALASAILAATGTLPSSLPLEAAGVRFA